jgi:hypothetical protein
MCSRVALGDELSFDLKDKFTMPHKNIELITPIQLPDVVEINEIVEKARSQAVSDLKRVGITSNCYAFKVPGAIIISIRKTQKFCLGGFASIH